MKLTIGELRTLARTSPVYRAALAQIETPNAPKEAIRIFEVSFTIRGTPIGKPRMTQRDKWAKRPAVLRYRAWCDEARRNMPPLPSDPSIVSWVAWLPLPESWSEKKKAVMRGKPHRQKPDRDNIDKAILDMLFKDDSKISSGSLEKRWDDGSGARIEVFVR